MTLVKATGCAKNNDVRNEMKAIITVGVSASGKSTWTKNFIQEKNSQRSSENQETWVQIERDKIRRQIQISSGIDTGNSGVNWKKWNWKDESNVTDLFWKDLFSAAECKFNVIISDTNLNVSRREEMKKKLEKIGFEVEIKEFPVTWEESCRRDNARENGVGYSVLSSQFEQWNKEHVKQYTGTVGKPKTVVCDIDGTIAHMNGRGPFEWTRVGEDAIDEDILSIVSSLYDSGYSVVFLSGRDGSCQKETYHWIDFHVHFPYKLFMRTAGDQRRDDIVKEEIFWNNVADEHDVKFVIDDRPQMCRKWRAMGIKTLQVANPYKEF